MCSHVRTQAGSESDQIGVSGSCVADLDAIGDIRCTDAAPETGIVHRGIHFQPQDAFLNHDFIQSGSERGLMQHHAASGGSASHGEIEPAPGDGGEIAREVAIKR